MSLAQEVEPDQDILRKKFSTAETIAILHLFFFGLAVVTASIATLSAIELAIRDDSKILELFLGNYGLSPEDQLSASMKLLFCSSAVGLSTYVMAKIKIDEAAAIKTTLDEIHERS